MAKESIAELESLLEDAAKSLPDVSSKKMFGCHALWVKENVFALVWKHGRIGFKLPDEHAYAALLKTTGAAPWKAGPMQMAHWVLVPETFHKKPAELKKLAAKAHAQCALLEKKPTKAKAKTKATTRSGVKAKVKQRSK